jgi:glucose/arabinose dehydrogenase
MPVRAERRGVSHRVEASRATLLPLRILAALPFIVFSILCVAAESPYVTEGQCGGLPRLTVTTAPGICVGVVASGFKFPRGILPLGNGDLLVADMGGWSANRGSLWLLKKSTNQYARQRLLDKLDRPHGLALGPDGRVYLGLVGRVVSFDPADPQGSLRDVIGGASSVPALPATGRHPLVNMVFGKDGALYVNSGSASDNCEGAKHKDPDPNKPCAEAEGEAPRGAIRRYEMRWPEGNVVSWKAYASGLRNSMALAVHPMSGVLLQGENARDNIHRHIPGMESDEGLPHDELNVIEEGARYGWPYCYDDGKPSPEYSNARCADYRAPLVLLPAHAAPLGMTYYSSSLLPLAYRAAPQGNPGALIVGYHGYRANGHRVVAFQVDARGLPNGQRSELVSGWDAADGRAMGAPTDVKVGADGAIYITEDRNGTVLRIAPQ